MIDMLADAPPAATTLDLAVCLAVCLLPMVAALVLAIRGRRPRDRVADAFRREVLRQGLTECEIDGRREVYRDGKWVPAAGSDR